MILQCCCVPGPAILPTGRSTTKKQGQYAELCGMIGTLGRRNFHRFLKACPLLCAASIPQPLVAEHLDMRVGELCELQR